MSKPRKVEVALASVGIVLLGLIAYWALEHNQPRPPGELFYAPGRDAGAGRGAGHAPPGRPGVRAPAAAPADAARIQGQVRDLLTGEGVAGVTVAFVPAGASTEITAESDAQGGYALALAPGRYRARAVGQEVVALDAAAIAPDADAGDDEGGAGRPDDGTTTRDLAREIAVAPRAEVRGFDIYVVRLARVHGRVVDGDGEPVAEALVRHRTSLLDRAIDWRHTAPTGEAWSGADGAFAVLVPPGRVTLLASAPGRTPSSTRIHWVAPGAELHGVEIVMDQGADVAGRVVDAAGKAVAGARVVGRVEVPEAGDDAPAGATGAVSSQDGAFLLRAVPPGRLVLQAEAAGHAPSPVVAVTVSGDAGRRDDVVLRLTAPAPLAGRVVDEQGAGVAGASVRALRPMSQVALPAVTTDAQGRFEVMLAPGPVDVTATAPGFAPGRVSGIAASSRAVVVELARGGAIAGVVTGRGQPLGHFTVHVAQRSAPGGAADFREQGLRVISPDGSYRVADLAPGRYSVTAAAPGLAPVEQSGVAVAPGREARVDLALAPGATLSGTVRDARSRAPVAGAVVRLSTGSELAMTYTDAGGGFAISDIAPGRRSLEVQHPGYVGRVESGIELGQGARQRVDVALAPAAAGGDQAFEIAGIGAVLVTQEERLMVQDLVPHGPAAVAGIEPGEEVFSIDGRGTREQSFGDNVEGIRGLAGTVVRLGLRLGARERFLDVVRGNVRVAQPAPPGED